MIRTSLAAIAERFLNYRCIATRFTDNNGLFFGRLVNIERLTDLVITAKLGSILPLLAI
jgi:hypothetical protein